MLLFFVMLFLAAPTIFAQRSSDSRLAVLKSIVAKPVCCMLPR